jgi:hypothetical protein
MGICGMLHAGWLVPRGHADVLHVRAADGGSVLRKAPPLCAARLGAVPFT